MHIARCVLAAESALQHKACCSGQLIYTYIYMFQASLMLRGSQLLCFLVYCDGTVKYFCYFGVGSVSITNKTTTVGSLLRGTDNLHVWLVGLLA